MMQKLLYLSLLIIGSAQYARCDNTPTQASPIVNEYSRNWTYSGEDMTIHPSDNWFSQYEIVFVAHDTSKNYCTVVHARTDKSNEDEQTCKYVFKNTDGEKVSIERVSNYELGGEGISLQWSTPKLKSQQILRSATISMKWCPNRLAPEKLDSEASAAALNTSESSFANETEIKYNGDISDILRHRMNFSWVGELEGPVEVNSTEGVYFLGHRNGSDSTNAMSMDLSTSEIQDFSSIGQFGVAKGDTRSSRAYKKFGQCYMKTSEQMSCSQQKLMNGYPEMVIFEKTVNFPGSIDWFFMVNLREEAILLVTGKCSGNICNSYSIRKLAAYENRVLVNIDNLGLECDNPSHLKNSIRDYIRNSMFCFHAICNHKVTGQNPGVTFQYRRHCIKRDVITAWGD